MNGTLFRGRSSSECFGQGYKSQKGLDGSQVRTKILAAGRQAQRSRIGFFRQERYSTTRASSSHSVPGLRKLYICIYTDRYTHTHTKLTGDDRHALHNVRRPFVARLVR